MPSNHLILCRPLLLRPSIFPSVRVFSNESALLIRWPKYWSFSFNISPSNEHPGLISFRMDWWDLLTVQGTLKSLLQHHSSKASILRRSAFFIVQFSHPYITTGKSINRFSCVQLCNLMDCSHQAPLSMGFSRQEYWRGLPCPPPGELPDPGIKLTSLMSPVLAGGFFTISTPWEAHLLGEVKWSESHSVVSDSLRPHGL